jgi:hypothetical protein
VARARVHVADVRHALRTLDRRQLLGSACYCARRGKRVARRAQRIVGDVACRDRIQRLAHSTRECAHETVTRMSRGIRATGFPFKRFVGVGKRGIGPTQRIDHRRLVGRGGQLVGDQPHQCALRIIDRRGIGKVERHRANGSIVSNQRRGDDRAETQLLRHWIPRLE